MNVIGDDSIYIDMDNHLILRSTVLPFEALWMGDIGRCVVSSEDAVADVHAGVAVDGLQELEGTKVIALSHGRSSLSLGGTIGGPWTVCVVCHGTYLLLPMDLGQTISQVNFANPKSLF
jgi:hypothetical protein